MAVATNQTVNFGVSLPEIALTANEHILVQFYLKQSAAMTTQRTVGIVSGDASSWISHPAATTRPSVPTLQTPAAALLLKTTTPTFTATFTDPGDTGQVNFRVCSDVSCTSVLQTFSSSAGNASGTVVAAQVPSAMTDNATYYWQVQGQDAAGITSAWSAGRAFTVNTAGVSGDVTPPSMPTVTVTQNPVSPNQYLSGTTLFYKAGGAGGSFDVTATGTTDAESGVNRVAFPVISGVTGGGNDAIAPYTTTYSWNNATSATGAQNVVSVNNGGLSSANAPFTFTRDAAGPSGGSVSYTNGFTSTTSVTITTADGTDAGAGVDTTTRLIERDSATLTNGTCGTFSGSWTTVDEPGHGHHRQLLRLPLHGRRQRRQLDHLHLAERGQGGHERAGGAEPHALRELSRSRSSPARRSTTTRRARTAAPSRSTRPRATRSPGSPRWRTRSSSAPTRRPIPQPLPGDVLLDRLLQREWREERQHHQQLGPRLGHDGTSRSRRTPRPRAAGRSPTRTGTTRAARSRSRPPTGATRSAAPAST